MPGNRGCWFLFKGCFLLGIFLCWCLKGFFKDFLFVLRCLRCFLNGFLFWVRVFSGAQCEIADGTGVDVRDISIGTRVVVALIPKVVFRVVEVVSSFSGIK